MPSPADPHAPADFPTTGVCVALVAVAALVPFLPTLFGGFFWDDHYIIRPDGPIASLANIPAAFRGRMTLFPEAATYPYYRPLVDVSFMVNYAIAGGAAWVYHAFSLLLHGANAVLAFLLFRGAGRLAAVPAASVWALLGAGLFAAHPLQVESVGWIAGRNVLMSVLFLQLAILAGAAAVRRDRWDGSALGAVAACVAAFVAALLSKEVAVVAVPLAGLGFAALPGARRKRLALVLLAVVVALAVYLLVNPVAGGRFTAVLRSMGPVTFVRAALETGGFYTSKTVLPLGLYPSYPLAMNRAAAYLVLGIAAAVAGAAVVAVLAWRGGRSAALLAAVGLLFCGGTAITPLLGDQFLVADRYVYQSLWGLGAAVAMLGALLRGPALPGRRLLPLLLVPAVLGVLTLRQSIFWTREDILWAHAADLDPQNVIANYQLGKFFAAQGAPARAAERYAASAFSTHPEGEGVRYLAAEELARLRVNTGDFAGALEAAAVAERGGRASVDLQVSKLIALGATGRNQAADALWQELLAQEADLSAAALVNLALVALRLREDPAQAARLYALARERGAPQRPELEALSATAP